MNYRIVAAAFLVLLSGQRADAQKTDVSGLHVGLQAGAWSISDPLPFLLIAGEYQASPRAYFGVKLGAVSRRAYLCAGAGSSACDEREIMRLVMVDARFALSKAPLQP